MSVIGEVVCSGTGCFQWTIDDFLSKVSYHSSQSRLRCQKFSFLGHEHDLELDIKKDINEVGVNFQCKYSPRRLLVRLGMNTGFNGKREYRSLKMDHSRFFRVNVWMTYSELIQRRSEILSNGKLKVFCELRILERDESPASLKGDEKVRTDSDSDDEATVSEHKGEEHVQEESDSGDEATLSELKVLKKLQDDLKNLLDSGEDCDVTIKVQGKEFPAHRNILRMRSPVFKSMFGHEMVEKLSGVVVIEDCDPETFPDLLNYLYTGSTRHISDENVYQLYTASDKYEVEELKEECAAYMKNHLSISNFCDILTLALRHSDKELIDLCTEFFCSNVKDIVKTATWQTFLRENTTVGNDLFLKSLSREK